ncbi:iron complex transport system ATP-binding protein [Faunimonas pinastri]|uniref:Iron complex transport system ATP-binding protein n=1 Tax=Faunimonas pinastri TaxID=1855383 RepID=A0A1H9FWH8_9HYPH|nr:ABC transporter ATP-binding protein [Faunimonas pinastri]SEQ42270.1 iron complex transport system ATP-binding protein [Faunimonas pinastri]
MRDRVEDAFHVGQLAVGYGRRTIIRDLSLPTLVPGEVTALVGPNGAGKSTLLRAMAGLIRSTGSLRLGAQDLRKLSLSEHASRVTYMPQTLPQRVALTAIETVIAALKASPAGGRAGAGSQIHAVACATLSRLGIEHLAMEALDQLSGGQRQMVSLAQALVREPQVLLLDEPTSALDLRYQHLVMKLVRDLARERGIVAVVVLHDLNLAAGWADRIAMLSRGELAAFGTPAEAINAAHLAAVYGVSARVEQCSRGSLQVMVDGPA